MSNRDSGRVSGLLGSVEARENQTRQFLREKGSGFIDQTVLQIASLLHCSEDKGREYFMKEWAAENISLKGNLWKWITDSGNEAEPFTDYIERKRLEKLRQKQETEKTNETQFSDNEMKEKLREAIAPKLKEKSRNEIKEEMIANGICSGNNCPPFSQDSCKHCTPYLNLNKKTWR